jgi:hypothetical protein
MFSQAQTPETTPTAAERVTPTPTPVVYAEEWPDIGPAIGLLFCFMFTLVLIGVGIVLGLALVMLGLVLAGVAALLVVLGIISTSSLVGVLSRRRGPAVTALFTQLGALAGAPVGVAVFWLFRQLADLSQISLTWTVIGGGIGGLLGGTAVGWLFSLALRRVYRWAEQRLHSLRESTHSLL